MYLKKDKKTIMNFLVLMIIVLFSIVIIPLSKNHVSIPLLCLLYSSPLLYIKSFKSFTNTNLAGGILILSLWQSLITHPEVFRLSTVMYSTMFIITFVAYTNCISISSISIREVKNLLMKLIYAFAVVQLFQQIGQISNTYIINESYNIVRGTLGKVNSLTAEASQTAYVMVALLYSFIKLTEIENFGRKYDLKHYWKHYRWLCISCLYVFFGTISVTCVFAFFLLMIYFVSRKQLIKSLILSTILLYLFLMSNFDLAVRIRTLLPVILSFDAVKIFEVDASSAARIGPYMIYFDDIDFFKFNTWFGHGCDYGGLYAFSTMLEHDIDQNIGVGGIVNNLFDYGLVHLFALIYFLTRFIRIRSFEMCLYIFIFSTNGFNMHTHWIFFYLMYLCNYFKNSKY